VTRRRRPTWPFSLAVVALVASLAGLFTFVVGRDLRTPASKAGAVRVSATSTAYGNAKSAAYRAGYAAAYRGGWARGVALARGNGARAGRAAGRAEAARRAAAAAAARSVFALATAAIPRAAARRTNRCVEVGGGLCEVLGPGATGRPCPAQSVPNPANGVVCVPQVLIQASPAATAAASSPSTR
jgi:hypothetical protein